MNNLHCTFLSMMQENCWIRVQFIHMDSFKLIHVNELNLQTLHMSAIFAAEV